MINYEIIFRGHFMYLNQFIIFIYDHLRGEDTHVSYRERKRNS